MAAVAGSGSQTAVIGTEHTLFDSAATGTYVLYVDPINMATGDVLELRIYRMVLTAGTRRVLYAKRIDFSELNVDDMIRAGEPVTVGITDSGAYRATLKQTAGTGRVFPWTVDTP